MASENEQDVRETLADIERDLRDRADCAERHGDRETNNDGVAMLLRSIADRIEAAAKRVVGNAAAMREALLWVIDRMNAALIEGKMECEETIDKCKSALSAPPRNCDVGTAEEQEHRYKATGEVYHTLTLKNALAWAQMPYAAEEGGAAC